MHVYIAHVEYLHTAESVPDNCVIVLLKDKYLNTLTQATKTLKAANSTKS